MSDCKNTVTSATNLITGLWFIYGSVVVGLGIGAFVALILGGTKTVVLGLPAWGSGVAVAAVVITSWNALRAGDFSLLKWDGIFAFVISLSMSVTNLTESAHLERKDGVLLPSSSQMATQFGWAIVVLFVGVAVISVFQYREKQQSRNP